MATIPCPLILRSISSSWNAVSSAPKRWPTRKRSPRCSPISNRDRHRRLRRFTQIQILYFNLRKSVKSADQKRKAYARAGVDVDLANKLKRGIGAFVRQTHGPQVLGKI